jgi:short-subunit dehydrogenase
MQRRDKTRRLRKRLLCDSVFFKRALPERREELAMSLKDKVVIITGGGTKKRRSGAIISIGSIWALQGIGATPTDAPSMAKGGVHSLTRALVIELAQDKIRVNQFNGNFVDAEMVKAFISSTEYRHRFAN